MTPLSRVGNEMTSQPAETIHNPTKVDEAGIQAILATGKLAIIAFDEACYDEALLQDINALCRIFGDELGVRFYRHHKTCFDGDRLALLPDVAWLSLDCMKQFRSLECLSDLRNLKKLQLGLYELLDPGMLSGLCLEELVELRIWDYWGPDLDLGPLERCHRLESLIISGQTNGIESICRLPALKSLRLKSIPKKYSLPRVDFLPSLRELALESGSREDIDDVSSGSLDKLSVNKILGLTTIGNLARFPSLTHLRVENQSQLPSVNLGSAPLLEKLTLANCKTLGDLGNLRKLASLTQLKKVTFDMTAINPDDLLAAPLPASIRTLRFWTGRKKADLLIRARLDALGYNDRPWG